MLLNEIFDTMNSVTWKATAGGYVGAFKVNDTTYFIDLDEFTLNLPSGLKTAADVGFRKGEASDLTNDNKPGRVIGSVLSGLKIKISELKPDLILFGALDKNGFVEKHKAVYHKIAHLLSKTTPYHVLSDWIPFSGGEYAYMANFTPTKEDKDEILVTAKLTNK